MAMNVDSAFWNRLLDSEDRGAIHSAEEAAMLMTSESGLNSLSKNSIGCVGLNQMCDGTLQAFYKSPRGQLPFKDLAEEWRNLPASIQLDAIERLWTYRSRIWGLHAPTARDLYWLNFLPATYNTEASDQYIIAPNAKLPGGDAQALGILKANPGLVEQDPAGLDATINNKPGKYVIRVAGLVRFLNQAASTSTYRTAVANIFQARQSRPQGPPGPPPTPVDGPPPNDSPPAGGPVTGPTTAGTGQGLGLPLGIGILLAIAAALWAALKR
jgi:hypothetical protein